MRGSVSEQGKGSNGRLTAHQPHVSMPSVVSTPQFSIVISNFNISGGAVAQLGARVNGIHEVAGSIPASSTKPGFSRVPTARTATDLGSLMLAPLLTTNFYFLQLPRLPTC